MDIHDQKPPIRAVPEQFEAFSGDRSNFWEDFFEKIPLGGIILSETGEAVKINKAMCSLLGYEETDSLNDEMFWDRLTMLALNAEKTRLDIERARMLLVHQGISSMVFQARSGKHYQLELYSLASDRQASRDYLGWVRDVESELQQYSSQISLLADICAESRMAAAGISGNIAALLNNYQTWSGEVQGDFLKDTADQLFKVQQSLDLALSYAGLITKVPIYREPVELITFLKNLFQKQEQNLIRAEVSLQAAENIPPVKIDPSLTTLALDTLLQEVFRKHPAGLQVEVLMDRAEGHVVLKLVSPRTLPLPGLVPTVEAERSDIPIKLALVSELLSSQGGKIVFTERPSQEGGGADIEIFLPVGEKIQRLSDTSNWKGLRGAQEGRILLAESQPDYQIMLRDELIDLGYRVDVAVDGSAALDMVQTINPDLVILARNLPGMDGLLVTQGIRRWSTVPVIMISDRTNPDDKLYAYRLGVDDYLHKPFLVGELLAKVRVFVSRQQTSLDEEGPELFQSGSIKIDRGLRQVWVRGSRVDLTPIEYNLLVYLSQQGRQIVPYEQLLESVWEGPEKGTRQGLFVHVRRLREKIEANPQEPKILRNKWGVGYVFNP